MASAITGNFSHYWAVRARSGMANEGTMMKTAFEKPLAWRAARKRAAAGVSCAATNNLFLNTAKTTGSYDC
jgi:hypothetical protein